MKSQLHSSRGYGLFGPISVTLVDDLWRNSDGRKQELAVLNLSKEPCYNDSILSYVGESSPLWQWERTGLKTLYYKVSQNSVPSSLIFNNYMKPLKRSSFNNMQILVIMWKIS